MARHRARQRRGRREAALRAVETLEAFTIALFADAETEHDEFCALAVAALAAEERHRLRSKRYGPRGPYNEVRLEGFLTLLFRHFSDRIFKAWMRMDRDAFWHIHDLVCYDPVFRSTGRRPQRPVKYQLATFFIRMGAEANIKTATVMGTAEGSTYLYVDRVCKALRNIRDDHLGWPGPQRREYMDEVLGAMHFPGCLGSGDGTYIRLECMPSENGYTYWCRKKFYAIIIQATVDHRARFTSYDFGWPGSVQDSRVFKNSHLWLHREDYFEPHEYILVDKGYPLTQFSIRPFNDYDLGAIPAEAERRIKWNASLSSLRIFVEHAFGRLKGRFPILRCMPGRHLQKIYKTVEALMVVHNILEGLGDDPEHISGFNGLEDDDVREVIGEAPARLDDGLRGDKMYRAGLLRRKHLVNLTS